jgi:hypothetical protein
VVPQDLESLRGKRAVRPAPGREAEHSGKPLEPDRLRQSRERLTNERRAQRQPETLRVRQEARERGAQQALVRRAAVGALDVNAGVVDEVHVVDAGRTSRHASEARQAAIDVESDFRRRRPVVLEHILDEVDAAARRIEFVAVEHVGWACGDTETAMHAGAQNLFRFGHIRIGKLRESEGGLHG